MTKTLTTAPPGLAARDKGRSWRKAGGVLWLLPFLVITIMVATRPEKRTVTHLYHAAVQRWWDHQPLYDGPSGMNYLPQFALVFGPYHLPPRAVGDILWRATAAAGLAAGLWLFCKALWGANRWRAFVMVSAFMLPVSLPAIRNGQANAHLAAVLLLAAWCLNAQRWWAATAWLCLAVTIKPLGLAAVGLAWVMYPRLWWRLALGFLMLGALPFLFGPPQYVFSQFTACLNNLRQCSEVTEHRFADLNGLLRTFGVPLTGKASLGVRACAGVFLTGLCWLVARRHGEPFRALIWLGAAAGFLMLFNPMNEANSYVILASVVGVLAWHFITAEARKRGWLLSGMVLSMGLLPNLLRPWLGNYFALAWHPTMTLVFLAVLIGACFEVPPVFRVENVFGPEERLENSKRA